MTIFFAPARRPAHAVPHAFLGRGLPLQAANDNGPARPGLDRTLTEALRHFSRHGLSAAEQAGHLAREAQAQGQADTCAYWLGICRTLDRRLAGSIAAALDQERAAGA